MCMCQASIPRPIAPRTNQGPPKAASTTGTGTGQGKGGGNVKGSKTYIEQSPGGTSRTRRWRPDYQGQEPPPEIFGQSMPKRHKPSKGKNALIPASGSVTSPPSVDEMELDNVRAELDHTKSSARATQQLLLSLWGAFKNINDKNKIRAQALLHEAQKTDSGMQLSWEEMPEKPALIQQLEDKQAEQLATATAMVIF